MDDDSGVGGSCCAGVVPGMLRFSWTLPFTSELLMCFLQFETWNGIKPLFSDALDAVVGKE